jgi:hypothetical protein
MKFISIIGEEIQDYLSKITMKCLNFEFTVILPELKSRSSTVFRDHNEVFSRRIPRKVH